MQRGRPISASKGPWSAPQTAHRVSVISLSQALAVADLAAVQVALARGGDGDAGEDRYKDHDRDEIPHSPSQPPPTLARCLSEPLSRSMRMAWLSCCGVSPPTRATCRRAPSPCVMIEM